MKNRCLALFLSVVMIVCLAACGSKSNEGDLSKETEEATSADSLEQSTDESSEKQNGIDDYFKKATQCDLGSYVDADVVSLRLDKAYFSDDIWPGNPGFSSYGYEDIEGEKYLVVKGEITNNTSEALTVSFDFSTTTRFAPIMKYKDQFYLCRVAVNNETDSSIRDSSLPVGSSEVFIICSIPDDDITSSSADLMLCFNDFQETIYDDLVNKIYWDECKYLLKYSLSSIEET